MVQWWLNPLEVGYPPRRSRAAEGRRYVGCASPRLVCGVPSRRLNCFAALYATYSTRPRRSRYFPYVASKIAPATAFVSFRDAELFVSGGGGERRSRETIRRHRPSLLEGECRLVVSTRVSGFAASPRFRVPAEGPSLPAIGANQPHIPQPLPSEVCSEETTRVLSINIRYKSIDPNDRIV